MSYSQEQVALAGQTHAQGILIRLLYAALANNAQDPKEWLDRMQRGAEREMKNTATPPQLSSDDTLIALNAGLATIRAHFEVLYVDRPKPK